jgi:hypothetical protein
LFNS